MKETQDNYENYEEDISDEEMTKRFNFALNQEIEKKKFLGLPITRYDGNLKKVYLEYPDGRKEYED